MAITPKPPGSVDAPNDLTPESAGSVAIPNTLTPESAGTVAVPNTITPEAAGTVAIPNDLTAQAAGSVAVPNTLTAEAAGSVAIPNTLTAQGAEVLPRTLCPTVDINYAAGLFGQAGKAINQDELITYSRSSSGTFIDRYLDARGRYQYYLNTDYVGSATNLIDYSEDLNQGGWSLESATLTTVNEKSPTGFLGVKKLVGDGTNNYHALFNASEVITGHTYSVYLKYSGNRWALLSSHYTSAPKIRGAFFDLLTGSVGQIAAGVSASMIPVGDGWYRCSITEGDSPSTIFTVSLSSDGNTLLYTDDAESGILVWGAQRTAGEKVLPYVKTLASSVSKTFSESQRIEYDAATGENLGALIEQASTNLCLRSEEFDNASWTKSNSTITANDTQAPDLTTSADKLGAGSTGSISPNAYQSIATTAATAYTISAFVKRSEASFVQIMFNVGNVANDPRVNFDLGAGSLGLQDADIDAASITPVGNDWFRISATVTAVGVSLLPFFALVKSAADTRGQTNSWAAGEGLYIWGAQIEQASVPTSYIPTTTAAVSRLADQVSIPVAGNVPSGDVTTYVSARSNGLSGLVRYLHRVKSLGADDFYGYISASGAIISQTGDAGVTAASFGEYSDDYTLTGVFSRTENNHYAYLDGSFKGGLDVGEAARPDPAGVVGIGQNYGFTNRLNGHIKRFTIYDEALTAAEVAQL